MFLDLASAQTSRALHHADPRARQDLALTFSPWPSAARSIDLHARTPQHSA